MLILVAFTALAVLIGIAVLAQVLVLHAVAANADHAEGKRKPRMPRALLPDLPV